MKIAHKLKIIGGSILALLVIFSSTRPDKMPSLMLIIPFLLMFLALWLILSVVIALISSRSPRKIARSAAFIAGLPILLLVLQSIGQLTLRDVMIIIALFAVSYFYVARTNTITNA